MVTYRDLTNIPPAAKRKKQDADSNLDDNDGDNYEDARSDEYPEVVFPINHLLHTMWKQVEVFAAGKLVSSGSSNYHYKS